MILSRGKVNIRIEALLLILLLLLPAPAQGGREIVRSVLDGDTLVTASGEKVRLLGIDTPEIDEPYSREATAALKGLVAGQAVTLDSCNEKDRYGRTLAVVTVRGRNVNLTMLEKGLARPMLIPPCGQRVARQVLETTAGAVVAGRGLYASSEFSLLPHHRASERTGQKAAVTGTVKSVHRGPEALHLNFGNDWRTDFTAVIFRGSLPRFRALGSEPLDLVGRRVIVLGRVREYNGPEIVIRGPEQIIPWP